jgi:hypothetical protein
MHDLGLSSSIISKVINDASELSSPAALGISASTADIILNKGYTRGFRTVFILHAVLNAVATIASVLMIKHKELTRGDEQHLREAAAALDVKSKEQKLVTDLEKALVSPSLSVMESQKRKQASAAESTEKLSEK